MMLVHTLAERLDAVRQRIASACARSHRKESDILLLAVTKVFPAAVIEEAYSTGLREFGENYVQEFEGKKPLLSQMPDAKFHLIGHLQSNKSVKAADLFDCVQTVDSAKLASRLSETAKPLEVMIEVKLSPEDAKYGILPEALPALAASMRSLPHLRLSGLMTMPPWSDDAELSRPYFRRLREFGAELNLPRLSMGMSHDLEVAIAEGSTIIRVGTALFGSRLK